MHFLLNLIRPDAVTMFVLALICLFGYGYPGYRTNASEFFWLLWLIGGVIAAIAWIVLMFT